MPTSRNLVGQLVVEPRAGGVWPHDNAHVFDLEGAGVATFHVGDEQRAKPTGGSTPQGFTSHNPRAALAPYIHIRRDEISIFGDAKRPVLGIR